jgi:hypothetical protein
VIRVDVHREQVSTLRVLAVMYAYVSAVEGPTSTSGADWTSDLTVASRMCGFLRFYGGFAHGCARSSRLAVAVCAACRMASAAASQL